MLLSFEIPLRHLEEFIPLEDFEFGLAHLMLDQANAEYRIRYQGCLLDNSMYETGAPMTIDRLLEAAELSNPCAVIAPDWMDDKDRTIRGVYELYHARPKGSRWSVSGVVQGRNYYERRACYLELVGFNASPICFPFRTPRDETIRGLHKERLLKTGHWYHLLGLRDLSELTWSYPGIWSCDTGKVFKGGLLLASDGIRGKGRLDLRNLLSLADRRHAHQNIAFLRWFTHAKERQDWEKRKK